MKKIIILLLSLTFCFIYKMQAQSLLEYDNIFKNELKEWVKTFDQFELKNFREKGSLNFENITIELGDITEYYDLYIPLLVYSKNKQLFIDLYSYDLGLKKVDGQIIANTDIDQAVFLYDIKKSKCTRIYFTTTIYSWISEAVWIDNNRFILAGVTTNEEDKQILDEIDMVKEYHHNKYPVILIGDINSQSFQVYANFKSIKKSLYKPAKLVNMNIEGLYD